MDIARLGASFDTSELKQGGADIRALVPDAKKAEKAVDDLGSSAANLAAGMAKGSSAAAQLAGAVKAETAAMTAATGAHDKATASAARAAAGVRALGVALEQTAGAAKAQASVRGLGAALEAAAGSMRLTAREGLNFSRQAADIGVTAAMGMNPLMIAIQQGPQLFDILQEKAIATGQSIRVVFLSLIAPLTPFIAAIGVVIGLLAVMGGAVALWLQGEKSALAYEKAVSGVGRSAGLTAAQLRDLTVAGAEQGNISIKAAQEQATAYMATGRIGGEVISGLLAIGKDYASFVGKDMTQATKDLATAMSDPAKAAVDLTREFGLLSQEQIKQIKNAMAAGDRLKAQKLLLDALTGAVKGHSEQVGEITSAWDAVARSIGNAITKLGEFLYMDKAEKLQRDINFRAGVERRGGPSSIRERQLYNEAGQRASGVQADRARASERARQAAANQAAQDRVDNKPAAGRTARSSGKSEAEKFSDITDGADRDIAALKARIAGIGQTEAAARLLTNQQKLLNEAASKGITLTAAQRNELMGLATTMTDLQTQADKLEVFEQITKGADAQLAALTAAGAEIDLTGAKLATFRAETEMLNQAIAKGVKLDEAQVEAIKAKAAAIGLETASVERRKFVYDTIGSVMARTAALKEELSYVGMSADAATRLRIENDLLAQARNRNIKLTADDITALKLFAGEQAEVQNSIRKTTEALDFAKGATRGFIGDLASGLQQGKSLWETFGNAVINVLNKVLDKMLDAAVNGLFDQGASNGGGGKTGWLATAVSWIGKAALGHAKGGAFDGATRFAKGSAFGNTVVKSPTLFSFAKGTQLGEMGEAGPEAIMPLKRGPNGSLGVEMYGGAGSNGGGVYAPVSVENHYLITGAISSKDIIDLTKQAAEQTKEEVKRNLNGWINQYNTDGAVV